MEETTSEDDGTLLSNAMRRVIVPTDNNNNMCRLFSPYRLPQEAVDLSQWQLIDGLPDKDGNRAEPNSTFEYMGQKVRSDIAMVEPGTAAVLKLAIFQWDIEASGRIRGMRLHPRSNTDEEAQFLRNLPKNDK